MLDSIQNINPQQTIISDSLSNNLQDEAIAILSFFGGDSKPVDISMPIHKISEIEHIIPEAQNWLALTFIGLIVYVIIIRFLFSFNIFENMGGLLKISSIDNVGFQKDSFNPGYLLFPISVFVLTFYLYFFINPQYLFLDVDYLYLVLAMIVVLYFLIKYVIESLISVIFNTEKMLKKYHYDQVYMLGISSVIQIPLLAIYIYSGNDIFLWCSLLVLSLLWGMRLLRGFVIGFLETNFSRLYIILYLCSLEVLPLLVAYKWFIM